VAHLVNTLPASHTRSMPEATLNRAPENAPTAARQHPGASLAEPADPSTTETSVIILPADTINKAIRSGLHPVAPQRSIHKLPDAPLRCCRDRQAVSENRKPSTPMRGAKENSRAKHTSTAAALGPLGAQ